MPTRPVLVYSFSNFLLSSFLSKYTALTLPSLTVTSSVVGSLGLLLLSNITSILALLVTVAFLIFKYLILN